MERQAATGGEPSENPDNESAEVRIESCAYITWEIFTF